MKHHFLSAFAILLMMSSCLFFKDKTQPEVLVVFPGDGSRGVSACSTIEITFSKKMEKPLSEKAFMLREGLGAVDGYLWWNKEETVLYFKPSAPLKKGISYQINISKSAEDISGNDLVRDYRFSFSVSSESERPVVLATWPASGISGVGLESNLRILFSEPIDKNTISEGLVISPSFDYRVVSTNTSSLVIIDPLSAFGNGVFYSVRLNSSIKDIEGNGLLNDHYFYFTAGSDFHPPVLNSVSGTVGLWSSDSLNEGIEKDSDIEFCFSEAVDFLSFENGLSFTPSVEGRFSWSSVSNVAFHPNDVFEIGQIYSLVVPSSVHDIAGNSLPKESVYLFKINGIDSLPVEIVSISNELSGVWVQNQPLLVSADGKATNIIIRFSSSMEQSGTMTKVGCRYLFGIGSSGVQIGDMSWEDNDHVLKIDLYGLDSGNTYRLTITGAKDGVKDKKGNYMIQDFIIDFKT